MNYAVTTAISKHNESAGEGVDFERDIKTK